MLFEVVYCLTLVIVTIFQNRFSLLTDGCGGACVCVGAFVVRIKV